MVEPRSGASARPATGGPPAEPAFDLTDERLARAAWSRVAEPGDELARTLVSHLGAAQALAWVYAAARGPAAAHRELVALGERRAPEGLLGDGTSADERSARSPGGGGDPEVAATVLGAAAVPGGSPPCAGRVTAVGAAGPSRPAGRPPTPAVRLMRAVARWSPRLDGLDPRRELRVLERWGGRLVVPGDPGWPGVLDDLAPNAPLCLWVRGPLDLADAAGRAVSVVGARACTDYGRRVTHEIATGIGARGFTVVSGGAYGIDAAAHRGALAADGPTVAFLAGGVDRLYPAGNTDLLRTVIDTGGTVVSEVPPGSVPSRVRFLQRNRLIAAFGRATVVVEAAWRSGSLSTAARAAELSRPVGAVPGPVTSMASSGCHRLLREGTAVCVTDAAEVAELAGALSVDAAPAPPPGPLRAYDDLDGAEKRAWEALPLRRSVEVGSVARAAGLSVPESLAALGRLELLGLARPEGGGWRRARRADRLS
ncbi:DNA-processing protein DprA [Cellulosimicrobium arenosum]|uniref:DNA-protecting protein DprA n=1 Tax=Cellulosimicrobium arenosum TaxID=2708133 RepID=A0A927G984_9MICO|nr:DNA-processing protein DprA [Cellulosimicrobium arenosum]MBD8079288.1 DNA-protecting protein DprA [Cellulosimicrobium arenosum]